MSRTLKEARWDDTSRTPSSRVVHDLARLRALVEHCSVIGSQHAAAVKATAPNIVVVLTDDQRFDSLFSMRHVRGALAGKGLTFRSRLRVELLVLPLACLDTSRAGCRTRRRCIRTSTGHRIPTEAGGHSIVPTTSKERLPLRFMTPAIEPGSSGNTSMGSPASSEPGLGPDGASPGDASHGRALLPLFPLREERSGDAASNVMGPPEGLLDAGHR